MIAQVKWVELRFNFDIPPGKYPALVERLAGTPARLEEKINKMPYMILSQPYENGWSIQEHAGHLYDLDELINNRLDDFEQRREVLTPADMTNRKTNDACHNDHDINQVLKRFRASRAAVIKRLCSYNEEMVTVTALHPRLNTPMRLLDMVHFFAEHDDHHLAAMTAIEKQLA